MSEKIFIDVPTALAEIETGLKNIASNSDWKKFLSFCSKFHQYSFQNSMLIYLQKPTATFVAGYAKWLTLGRHVRKGEKGIRIFAPLIYKKKSSNPSDDDKTEIHGFKLVSVFDVSQTDGDIEALPTLNSGHFNHPSNTNEIYLQIIKSLDIPVIEKDDIAAKGIYHVKDKQIEVKSSLPSTHKIKTVLHEYSHHLHHVKFYENEPRGVRELIAESSAYIISSYLGIDTSSYSFPYINSWCPDPVLFKSSCVKISNISTIIISMLEDTTDSVASIAI